jgi:hypothetical protein
MSKDNTHVPCARKGTGNLNAKLTLDKVRYILGSSRSNGALARELRVSPACISNVRTGRTWAWIDADWGLDDEGEWANAA